MSPFGFFFLVFLLVSGSFTSYLVLGAFFFKKKYSCSFGDGVLHAWIKIGL